MEISKDNKVALVFKGTSLVAKSLIQLLVEHQSYEQIIVFDTEKLTFKHSKIQYQPLDFDEIADQIKGDDLFCFYGIEQAKKYQSDIKIKQLFSFQIAKLAAMNGVNQLCLLSSSNASKDAMNFNSRIRAHLEESVNALPFWAVHTFRPTTVVDTSKQSQWGGKIANRIGKGLDQVTGGLVSKYRPTEANIIAKSMLKAAQQLQEGRFLYQASYFTDMEEKERSLKKQ